MGLGKILAFGEKRRAFTKSLFDIAPYYPETVIVERKNEFREKTVYITTKLRIKHEETWYIQHHVQSVVPRYLKDAVVSKELMEQLNRSVYLALKFGKIDPNMNDAWGEPLWPKDPIQISEEERLKLK